MDQGKAQSGAYNIVVYASPDKTTTIQRITDPSSFQIIKRSGGFTSIQLLDGREGYIESRFLEFPLELLELKQDQVPMYPSASVKPGPKATLVQGVLIECIGDVVEADGIRWLPIKSPHGQTGYIRDDTKRAPPSRFFYLRHVSRIYFINVLAGAGLCLLGIGITVGSFLLSQMVLNGGWFISFRYGLILVGGGQFVVAVVRLREEIAIQRRKFQQRFK